MTITGFNRSAIPDRAATVLTTDLVSGTFTAVARNTEAKDEAELIDLVEIDNLPKAFVIVLPVPNAHGRRSAAIPGITADGGAYIADVHWRVVWIAKLLPSDNPDTTSTAFTKAILDSILADKDNDAGAGSLYDLAEGTEPVEDSDSFREFGARLIGGVTFVSAYQYRLA